MSNPHTPPTPPTHNLLVVKSQYGWLSEEEEVHYKLQRVCEEAERCVSWVIVLRSSRFKRSIHFECSRQAHVWGPCMSTNISELFIPYCKCFKQIYVERRGTLNFTKMSLLPLPRR
jgi:hypothetical protein